LNTDFQISYTLDILFFIDCMIDEKKKELYEDDIYRLMPMLGTVSDKYIEKLIKMNQHTPRMIEHLVSILLINEHLHEWSVTDLLDRHKHLIKNFKKTKQFSSASKDLKKFIKSHSLKAIPLIKAIVIDLERLDFKKFWLEEKLPLLKEKITEYQMTLGGFNIASHVNKWVMNKEVLSSGQWYLLIYSGADYKTLLQEYRVTSAILARENLFECIISYALQVNSYKDVCKLLKPTQKLQAEFKSHEECKKLKKISNYVETSLKMALKIYLLEGCGTVAPKLPDNSFANEILNYLYEFKKQDNIKAPEYLGEMMKKFSK